MRGATSHVVDAPLETNAVTIVWCNAALWRARPKFVLIDHGRAQSTKKDGRSAMHVEVLHCPSCGAPSEKDDGVCDYCGSELQFSRFQRVARRWRWLWHPAWQRIVAWAGPVLAPVAGWLSYEVVRTIPALRADPKGIAVGITLLVVVFAVTRRRPASIALALAAGLVLVSKPWIHPMPSWNGSYGLFSILVLQFVIPGVALLVLATISALRVRKARAVAAEVRPRLISVVGLAAGFMLALWLTPPTVGEVFEDHRASFEHAAAFMAELGPRLESSEAPRRVGSLTPPPHLDGVAEDSNASIIAFDKLTEPGTSQPLDAGLGGLFAQYTAWTLGTMTNSLRYPKRARLRDRQGIEAAAATRWLCVYRKTYSEFEIWVVDLESEEVVVRRVSRRMYGDEARAFLLTTFAEATGGSFLGFERSSARVDR
jgi:predicted nucleic acid-binding Zn ribbon protein